jgi:hypothetical protein
VRAQASEISQLKQQSHNSAPSLALGGTPHMLHQQQQPSSATIMSDATSAPVPPVRPQTSSITVQPRRHFLPGEYVIQAFAPGSRNNPPECVYQIVSHRDSPQGGLWYRCRQLELAPQDFGPQVSSWHDMTCAK